MKKTKKNVIFVDNRLTSETSSDFRTRIGRENIGAQLVAACCRQIGWRVRYLQPDSKNIKVIYSTIVNGPYDVLVFFPYTHTKWLADKIARLFKGEIPIIYGGYHTIGANAQNVFEEGIADYVISGRGEERLPELLQKLEAGTVLPGVISNKTTELSEQYPLDNLPWPIREESLMQNLGKEPLPFKPPSNLEPNPRKCVVIAGSIGCTGHCDFCSSWIISTRSLYRSPRNVIEEMLWLRETYGPGLIYYFADPLFNADRDWVIEICSEMEKHGPFPSICMPDLNLDKEMVQAMKRAGIYIAMLGVEFPSDELRAKRGKRPGDAAKAFELCDEAGILTRAFLMTGRLGMTRKNLDAEIDILDNLGLRADEWRVGFETPFPGTIVSDQIKPEDVIVDYPYWTADRVVYRTGLSPKEWEEARLGMLRNLHFCKKQREHYDRKTEKFPELGPVYEDFLERLRKGIEISQYS